MATTKVRVSLWPDKEIEVDEAEVANLRQQGLLIEPETTAPAETPAPVRTKTSKES